MRENEGSKGRQKETESSRSRVGEGRRKNEEDNREKKGEYSARTTATRKRFERQRMAMKELRKVEKREQKSENERVKKA